MDATHRPRDDDRVGARGRDAGHLIGVAAKALELLEVALLAVRSPAPSPERDGCAAAAQLATNLMFKEEGAHSVEAVTNVRGSAKHAALTNSECMFSKSEVGSELFFA